MRIYHGNKTENDTHKTTKLFSEEMAGTLSGACLLSSIIAYITGAHAFAFALFISFIAMTLITIFGAMGGDDRDDF